MRRLLAVLLVCSLGFILGAALREASRTAPSAAAVDPAAVDPATASDLEALRADVAALEQRLGERLAEVQASAAPAETTDPQDEPALTPRLPEQISAAPAAPSTAELAALRADLATLEQRLTERLDALAAEQRATADLETRLDALEDDIGQPNNPVEPLPNAPLPRP